MRKHNFKINTNFRSEKKTENSNNLVDLLRRSNTKIHPQDDHRVASLIFISPCMSAEPRRANGAAEREKNILKSFHVLCEQRVSHSSNRTLVTVKSCWCALLWIKLKESCCDKVKNVSLNTEYIYSDSKYLISYQSVQENLPWTSDTEIDFGWRKIYNFLFSK